MKTQFFTWLIVLLPLLAFSQAQKYADNQLIVKVKEQVAFHFDKNKTSIGIAEVDAINENYKVASMEQFIKSKPKTPKINRPTTENFLLFTYQNPIDIENMIEVLMQTNKFDFVEPNFIGHGGGVQYTPNDQWYNRQWHFNNDGTFNSDAVVGADVSMEGAWDITKGSSSIVAAILDSGVKLDHPEWSGRIWSNAGDNNSDGMDDDANGYVDDAQGWDFANTDNDATDDHGHGTNVAGILSASGDNSIGYAGVDWNCQVMNLKILDDNNSGFYSWWTSAIYYAVDNGADVSNMSVGGSGFSNAMQVAVNYAHTNGVPVIACMMNNDDNVTNYPAGYANTIAVGATGVDDERVSPFFWSNTSGSSYGSHIDLVAPGSPIHGLKYDSNTNYNTYWGGTSQATPIVAGVASLIKSIDPSFDVETIRDILRNTAEDQVGNPAEDISGFDDYYGAGRLNAHAAVQLAYSLFSNVNDLKIEEDVVIFPVPTKDIFSIKMEESIIEHLMIYNSNGQLIQSYSNVNPQNISVKTLPSGVYFITIKNEEKIRRGKLIKK